MVIVTRETWQLSLQIDDQVPTVFKLFTDFTDSFYHSMTDNDGVKLLTFSFNFNNVALHSLILNDDSEFFKFMVF